MRKLLNLTLLLGIILIWSCSEENVTPDGSGSGNSNTEEWLIPQNEVRDGGPGKDGIPAINDPNFSELGQVDFLDPNDLVILIKSGEAVKAYPHPILDWHEIANEELNNGNSLSLTYCPLTGTAIAWNSNLNGDRTTFGVSGLLYNSNLMPYDRKTDSYWSQMEHKCVKGALVGTEIGTFHIIETTYNSLREMYPDALVMNTNTGFNRNYQRYPYGDYRTNHNNIIFPVSNDDSRVPNKERVLGVVVNDEVLTYRFKDFQAAEVSVIQNQFEGINLVVIGSTTKNFLTAFENRTMDGTLLNFEPIQDALPIVMQDKEGNKWDIFGKAVEGPRRGETLPEVLNYIGYWFSWAAFNEDLEIYNE